MLPNFFVLGANKAGTTSLHRYLAQHPEVFMCPVKEPYYFAHEGELPAYTPFRAEMEKAQTREAYEALFAGVNGETAIGESSTGYLPNSIAARRIREEIPHARLIAVLRDPSERAHSAHAHARREGKEPIVSFEGAVEAELEGCRWRSYVGLGYYAEGIARYTELFGPEQLKVFLYEDLRDEPLTVVREIFEHLHVDPAFTPDVDRRYNVSSVPRSTAVDHALRGGSRTKSAMKAVLPVSTRRWMKRRAHAWNRESPQPLSPEMRARLVGMFDEDIRATEALIGRDLSSWRTP